MSTLLHHGQPMDLTPLQCTMSGLRHWAHHTNSETRHATLEPGDGTRYDLLLATWTQRHIQYLLVTRVGTSNAPMSGVIGSCIVELGRSVYEIDALCNGNAWTAAVLTAFLTEITS